MLVCYHVCNGAWYDDNDMLYRGYYKHNAHIIAHS